MSSSRSRDGPGRFRSGLWDIQHRARATSAITPSRGESEGIKEGGTQLRRALSDAGTRDTPIGTQEHYRFRVRVEPGFDTAASIADDHDIGIVVPGPVQLRGGPQRNKARAHGFPGRKRLIAENLAWVVVPAQHREPVAEHIVQQDVVLGAGINPRLYEQGADRRLRPTWFRVHDRALLVARHRLEPDLQYISLERGHN